MIVSTPVEYEITDVIGLLAKVKLFDEVTVEVEISGVYNLKSWNELNHEIEKCIQGMVGDGEQK